MLFILGKKMMTYNRIGPAHNSGLLKFYLYRCNSLSWPLFHSITAGYKFLLLKRARVTIAHGMNIISVVKHKKLDVDVTFWLFFVKNLKKISKTSGSDCQTNTPLPIIICASHFKTIVYCWFEVK